ncbi:MAG: diguanylate cyclase [Desulfobacterales bacterium]|nr:diguanylate cyclase [Desulfobacterales bacterium]
MKPDNNTQEKLNDIINGYAKQLPDKIKDIETICEQVFSLPRDDDRLKKFHRIVHTLAGSSGFFGYKILVEPARELSKLIKNIIENNIDLDEILKIQIKKYIGYFNELINTNDKFKNQDVTKVFIKTPNHEASITQKEQKEKLIFIVEDDKYLRESLSIQIQNFGYKVYSFANPEDLQKNSKNIVPSLIIADIIFSENSISGIDFISKLDKTTNERTFVIFISTANDPDTRLRAVKAGGDAYITKPINFSNLIEKIESLLNTVEIDPYRILIVEDEPELSSYYSAILEGTGMKTMTVNDPSKVFAPLVNFYPDLILMDMYMPQYSGIEIAKCIRQMDSFFSIPIVFLSAETDKNKQMAAMSMGGDDFLIKPIEPNYLISSVTIRAERMRILRSFMEKDGLTGLFNHTKIKENLVNAFKYSSRNNIPLSFAMIDIDSFKNVNDTYGHPVGDKVIVAMSKLLQQRLRSTDIIGRYGGEEFAVILKDINSSCAKNILNDLCVNFSKIKHQAGDKEFFVTFSAGIASFPNFNDPVDLCDAADKALYKAKNFGKNQVVVAEKMFC